MDFDFVAGGIEDGTLAILEDGMTGVKAFETYSGQLDNENLKRAIGEMSNKYPLIMVSYADGVDIRSAATSAVLGRSLHFRHDCSFVVICAADDPRGEKQRRRGSTGTYAMMAKVRELLTGRRISKVVDGVTHLLTSEPLIPVSNEFVAKLPNITAYAVIFETSFNWSSPDRTAEGIPVTDFVLDVESLNSPRQNEGLLPGVEFE